MLSQQEKQTAYSVALLDALALVLAFSVAFIVRLLYPFPFLGSVEKPALSSHIWMLFLAVPLFWVLASNAGLYRRLSEKSFAALIWASFRPFIYLGLILGTAMFLFQASTFSRSVFFVFLALAFLVTTAGRLVLLQRARNAGSGAKLQRRVLIVGVGAKALEVASKVSRNRESPSHLIGHLTGPGETSEDGLKILGTIEALKEIVEEEIVDEVVFAIPLDRLLSCEKHIAWCEEVGVTVHLKMDFVRTLFAKTSPTNWDDMPMLTISSTPQDVVALLFKRLVDVLVSGAALVLLSPVLGLCVLGVRLTSSGPILFKQKRVGLNGREFELYKFRSMYADAEDRRSELENLNEASGPVFKIKNDPRVTPLGRRLRKYSLDELPQLWNVLRGDMSLVGPRPPVPEEVRRYQRWQRRRLSMKPGITCLWQVGGRSQIGFDEWMKLDLAYIDNWSIKLDFIILLRTVPAVLLTRGAH